MHSIFDGIFRTVRRNGFEDEDIIKGLTQTRIKGNRLYTEIKRYAPPIWPGISDSTTADILKNDEVLKAFKNLFENCIRKGWSRKQIETALYTLHALPQRSFVSYCYPIQSDEI